MAEPKGKEPAEHNAMTLRRLQADQIAIAPRYKQLKPVTGFPVTGYDLLQKRPNGRPSSWLDILFWSQPLATMAKRDDGGYMACIEGISFTFGASRRDAMLAALCEALNSLEAS